MPCRERVGIVVRRLKAIRPYVVMAPSVRTTSTFTIRFAGVTSRQPKEWRYRRIRRASPPPTRV